MMMLSQAAHILGGKLIGKDVLFLAVSTDSRTTNTGDLFVALQGEFFNGATYIAAAVEKGAVAALTNTASYSHCNPSPCSLILVENTRVALGVLAAYWRTQFKIPLVAVTGSNGKTTVKEMLASILRTATNNDQSVLATHGNLNNDIGVPLTLLQLRNRHRYAVIEMGMNHSGEIEYLSRMARPDVAIINNAGNAHLAGLGSVNAVAQAKGEIFTGLTKQGTAIINADDAHAPLWRELSGDKNIIEFSLNNKKAVHAIQWQTKTYSASMSVSSPHGILHVQLQVPGMHNIYNALAATAAALALNIPTQAITAGLEKFPGVPGRLQRKAALHGAILIDDSYNANPASLLAALKVLAQFTGKKILVLGDMGELGEDAVQLHEEIGMEALLSGVDQLLTIGKLSFYAAKKFGMNARHFEKIEDLLDALDTTMNADTMLLVKGSRFMRMERVVHHCTAENDKNKKAASQEIPQPVITIPTDSTKD